jgi:hypothetical protein
LAAAVASMALLLAGCRLSNTAPITVPDGAPATGYPSTSNTSGEVGGCVTDINVTLHGVTHQNPDDFDILLENGGQKVLLMSDAGGSNALAGVDITFDDEAASLLPDSAPIAAGAYRPTDFEPGESLPGPAPAAPYGTSLSDFASIQPFGTTWRLYVVDDTGNTVGGTIANGWTLYFTECGQSTPAVVRQSTTWLLRDSVSTGQPVSSFTYGNKPLVPFFGDWDGNGSETPGTFENGVFKLSNTYGGPAEASPYTFTFGDNRGFPVAGDFDGDGRDDVAVYRNGTWQIRMIDDGATSTIINFGAGTWPAIVPLAGNWMNAVDPVGGHVLDSIGHYVGGQFTFRPLITSPADGSADFHPSIVGPASGGYPVVGAWDDSGIDTAGYKVGTRWTVQDCGGFGGCVEFSFDYGLAGDLPLSWRASTPI